MLGDFLGQFTEVSSVETGDGTVTWTFTPKPLGPDQLRALEQALWADICREAAHVGIVPDGRICSVFDEGAPDAPNP